MKKVFIPIITVLITAAVGAALVISKTKRKRESALAIKE